MKKAGIILVVCLMCLTAVCLLSCKGKHEKIAPTYQGMSVENHMPSRASNAANGADPGLSGDYIGKGTEIAQGNPFGENAETVEAKAQGSLSVLGESEEFYYAEKNQDIFIVIKLSNPDNYEIQSFTLNGKKYANYMFEYGSDMENLILKVNVGNADGILDYTLDAIKYIDGTDIKDVALDGNRTVKVGIRTNELPYATMTTDLTINLTSASFGVKITDNLGLIGRSQGYARAVLYDGNSILSTKDLVVGDNAVAFEGLTPNSLYQYAVVAYYDSLNGEGRSFFCLHKKAFYTNALVLFKDVTIGRTSLSWDYSWNEEVSDKSFTKIELYLDNQKIKDIGNTVKSVNNLYSARNYMVKAYYKNALDQEESISISVTTDSAPVPTVDIKNLSSTKTDMQFDLVYDDPEHVGEIKSVALYQGDNLVKNATIGAHIAFTGLQENTLYSVKISYEYSIGDGYGKHNEVFSFQYPTVVSIAVENINLLNTNVVKIGEELNMRLYFINPMKIEMTAIYINGQAVTVVGGDRIESAIVKFAAKEAGVIDFHIDRVDFLFNGVLVSQKIDSGISVQYPVYSDLNVTFTPVTSLYYELSGDGIYFAFDNPYGYTVFKVEKLKLDGVWEDAQKQYPFYSLGDGKYYFTGNSIASIEYGYEGYGHAVQYFSYNPSVGKGYFTGYYSGGRGSKAIKTVYDFLNMEGEFNYLANDIDLRGVVLTQPIALTGVLLGNGHKIRGLQNIIDVSQNTYFDIFSGGTIYDTEFTELYISVNASEINPVTISPLGAARLVNCSVKGDINGNAFVTVNNISATYDINVTLNNQFENRKFTAETMQRNNNVMINEEGFLQFTLPDGKKCLFAHIDGALNYTLIKKDVSFFFGDALIGDVYYEGTEEEFSKVCFIGYGREIYETNKYFYASEHPVISGYYWFYENGVPTIGAPGQHTYYHDQPCQQKVCMICGYVCRPTTEHVIVDGVCTICGGSSEGSRGLSYTYDSKTDSYVLKSIDNCEDSEIVIPSLYNSKSVTSIGWYAFGGSGSVTSVMIPDSVTSIGDYAFSGCTSLTSITFGNSVTSIGEDAFYGCALTSITIPDSVASIGKEAFYNCRALTSITIGNGVTRIGDNAFYDCNSLTSVYYTGDIASWCGITFGWNSNPLGYAHNLYINNELVTQIAIPDTVTEIKGYAFNGWNGTSITIPDSVTSIGNYAFEDCTSLTSVYYTGDIASWCGITFGSLSSNPLYYVHNLYINNELVTEIVIPDTVTEIKGYAFNGWNGTSITIPDSVTSIGDDAFSGCTSLTSITIPDSVTTIGWAAFSGCTSLTSITFQGTKARWNVINEESFWDSGTGSRTIHCTDGDITK